MSERGYFSFSMSNGLAVSAGKLCVEKAGEWRTVSTDTGELKDVLRLGDKTSDDYKFTIEQVRAKLKWFKKEWRSIDNKIICGSGLGRKNTKVPKCYDIMNPQFCDAVDDITSLRVFSFLSYYTRRFAVLKFISDRFSVWRNSVC